MIEIAHFALCSALVAALLQTALPLIANRADTRMLASASPLAVTQCMLVGVAFLGLVQAYVSSDFSVANVWNNSHSAQPLIYRITATWGNHEGSLLLWTLILSLFGASVAVFGAHLPVRLKGLTLSVQGSISVAFLLLLLLTSNPFERLSAVPGEGQDLNPILQDLGLAIHPPLLYIGYVGFSITFAFAVAALIEGRVDAAWARWVRPWALAAWAFLTLGIAMGSYWAYYELGWGGWWFWDPVENASLLPWLSGTALLHSAIVVEKRGALKTWTILLALLTFALSLLGTFLVRSGVLTSVHTFATDPARGLAILAVLVFFVGGSFALFALPRALAADRDAVRAREPRNGARFEQLPSDGGRHNRACRNALPGRLRSHHRRQDFRRSALLQPRRYTDVRGSGTGDPIRSLHALEARRPGWYVAAVGCQRTDRGRDRPARLGRTGTGNARAARHRARHLHHGGFTGRTDLARQNRYHSTQRHPSASAADQAGSLGRRVCAFRYRRCHSRRHRVQRLADRNSGKAETGAKHGRLRLHLDLRGHSARSRPQLARRPRGFRRVEAGRTTLRTRPLETLLRGPPIADGRRLPSTLSGRASSTSL